MFLKGKSSSLNTPVSAHCIQNKTQTLRKGQGAAPAYLYSLISLHLSLTQDTAATLTFSLSPE